MPKNVGIPSNCVLCPYHGRSDHVKRHIIKHHGGIVASETVRLVGRVAVLVTTPNTMVPERKHFMNGACLECGTIISKQSADPKPRCLEIFVDHRCKAKQQRAAKMMITKASPKAPKAAAKEESDDESEESINIPELMNNSYQSFYEDIIDHIDSTELPVEQKNKFVNMLEGNKYEEEDGSADYKVALMGFVKDLIKNASTRHLP